MAIELASMITSDKKEIEPETRIVTKKIVTTQRIVLFLSFLVEVGSDLDKGNSPQIFIIDGDKQDKSYGLGRVVFHRTKPAVAAQAVSVYFIRSLVAKVSTRLPLSPYCNPPSAQLRQPRCFPLQNDPVLSLFCKHGFQKQ